MRELFTFLLNVIWVVFAGFIMFIEYMLAGVLLCLFIVTIPWGIASFRIGAYALWPFGREVVSTPTSGAWSVIGNVIWVVLVGWIIALSHIITGIGLCVTIVGIPMGIASFKMVPVSLAPLGKQIVSGASIPAGTIAVPR